MCEDLTQGRDFVEPETWYNKKQCTEKDGVDGWDVLENAESDLTHACDFVGALQFCTLYLKNTNRQSHHPNSRGNILVILLDLYLG